MITFRCWYCYKQKESTESNCLKCGGNDFVPKLVLPTETERIYFKQEATPSKEESSDTESSGSLIPEHKMPYVSSMLKYRKTEDGHRQRVIGYQGNKTSNSEDSEESSTGSSDDAFEFDGPSDLQHSEKDHESSFCQHCGRKFVDHFHGNN